MVASITASQQPAFRGGTAPRILMSATTVSESATIGTVVGTLSVSPVGAGGWAFTETSDVSNKFAVNLSTGVVTTTGTLDYETASSHSLSVQASDGTTVLTKTVTITVTNVLEAGTLTTLSLDVATYEEDASRTSNILGTTTGSTLSVSSGSLPTGMTLNSASRVISGTPTTPGIYSFSLTETLADAVGSPKTTSLSITITAAASGGTALGDIAATDNVLVLAIGQSNAQTANTDAAMAATKFGSVWNSTHRQWVVASNAWQSYVPGTNSNHEGTNTGENWSWEAALVAARAGLSHTGRTDVVKECVAGNGVDPKYNNGNWYPGGTHPEGYTPNTPGTRVTGMEAQLTAAFAANTAAGASAYNRIKITWTQGEKDLDALGSATNYRVIFAALVNRIRANSLFTGIPIDFLIVRIRPTNGTTDTERHLRGTVLRNGAYLAMTSDLAAVSDLTVGMIDVDPCGVGFPANDQNIHPASGDPNWMYQAVDRVQAYYAGTYTSTYGSISDTDPGTLANLVDSGANVGSYATSSLVDMASLIQQRATIPTLPAGVEAQVTAFDGTVITDWTNTPGWVDKFMRVQFRHQIASTSTDTTFTLQIGTRTFTWRALYGAPTLVPVFFDTTFSTALVSYSTTTSTNDTVTRGTTGACGVRVSGPLPSTKCYIKVNVANTTPTQVGIFTSLTAGGGGNSAGNRAGLSNTGIARYCASAGVESTDVSLGANPSTGSAIEFAIDWTNKLYWVRLTPSGGSAGNWNANASANPDTGVGGLSIAGLSGTPYFGAVVNNTVGASLVIATGASPLTNFPRMAL